VVFFIVLVGIDVVNVMAAYQLICRHNIDYVYTDSHNSKPHLQF
jgi:hypothetical protein